MDSVQPPTPIFSIERAFYLLIMITGKAAQLTLPGKKKKIITIHAILYYMLFWNVAKESDVATKDG